jgi:hypothetical protein
MLSLAAHTQPLVEGIPPASDQGRMVAIKATTNQYGRVMKFTDKVNWAVVDPLISEYTRQLSLKIPEMKDILAQQALLAECQMFYACEKEVSDKDPDILVPKAGAKDVTHIKFMSPDCAPTIDEFRKIVLSMEAAKVRPYQGSNFLALISSAVMFDLITDKRVKEFMKYVRGLGYEEEPEYKKWMNRFKEVLKRRFKWKEEYKYEWSRKDKKRKKKKKEKMMVLTMRTRDDKEESGNDYEDNDDKRKYNNVIQYKNNVNAKYVHSGNNDNRTYLSMYNNNNITITNENNNNTDGSYKVDRDKTDNKCCIIF